jgi:hypothetical protein
MGEMADIIRLETAIIKRAMMTKTDVLENEVHRQSGLTSEQWIAYYAPKFRLAVADILKRTGKIPTAQEVERILYSR